MLVAAGIVNAGAALEVDVVGAELVVEELGGEVVVEAVFVEAVVVEAVVVEAVVEAVVVVVGVVVVVVVVVVVSVMATNTIDGDAEVVAVATPAVGPAPLDTVVVAPLPVAEIPEVRNGPVISYVRPLIPSDPRCELTYKRV